jgi:hypothetical protein
MSGSNCQALEHLKEARTALEQVDYSLAAAIMRWGTSGQYAQRTAQLRRQLGEPYVILCLMIAELEE